MIGILACQSEHIDTATDTDTVTTLSPYERDLAPKLLNCSGCHQGDSPDGSLDLTDVFAAIDQPSLQASMVLIASGNHVESYLWHKVNGSHGIAGGQGTRMPIGGEWSEEDIDLLALWIDLGCPP